MTQRKTSEKKRLAALKADAEDHPSVNTAKRYKSSEAAVEIIAKAGAVHGQQSRAIQVAVELLRWARKPDDEFYITDDDTHFIRNTPLIGKTYKLTERTVTMIDEMVPAIGTRGKVMCAVAVVLTRIDKIEPLPRGKPTTKEQRRETKKLLREIFGKTSSE